MDILVSKMNEIAEEMKEYVRGQIATEIQKQNKMKWDFSYVNVISTKRMNELWKNPFDVVPGKQFIRNLSTWSKKEYGVSFQVINLVPFFKVEEIPDEIRSVITSIVEGKRIIG